MTDLGHNSEPDISDRLRSIVERYERLESEVADIRIGQKDIMAEARSGGLDVKVLRQLIRIRKMDANELQEQETLLELYRRALGN